MKEIIINVEIVNAILSMDLHVCVNVFVHVCICALTCISVFGIQVCRCVCAYARTYRCIIPADPEILLRHHKSIYVNRHV